MTLRDSWGAQEEVAAAPTRPSSKSAKATTRPPKKSRAEYRTEARVRDPELAARFAGWPASHGITEAEADLLTGDRATGDLFLEAVAAGGPAPAVARWIVNELPPALGDRSIPETALTGDGLGALVTELEGGTITSAAAKEVFAELVERGGDPRAVIAERGLAQVSDETAIAALVDEAVAANPDKAAAYRAGKTGLFGFFVGQVLRASQGKANPQVVQHLLKERLG